MNRMRRKSDKKGIGTNNCYFFKFILKSFFYKKIYKKKQILKKIKSMLKGRLRVC
jgi:hypothetical protein